MSSASKHKISKQMLQRRQLTEVDYHIEQIVRSLQSQSSNDIQWKYISSLMWERFKIKISYKSCYGRWKNNIDPKIDPQLKLEPQIRQAIFKMHQLGSNRKQIQTDLELPTMTQRTFKNTIRVIKQSMARVLKGIYEDQVRSANIPEQIFKKENEHFKIFTILFSTSQLLRYYSSKKSFPISLTDYRSLIKKYDDQRKVYLRLKQNSPVRKQYEESIKNMKDQIEDILKNMLEIYEQVYHNKQRFEQLIGTKDKKLEKKFIYLKSIILRKPIKVLEGSKQFNQNKDVCQEMNCEMQLMDKPAEFQTIFLGNTEIKQEISSKKISFFEQEIEEESNDDIFFLPFDGDQLI